MNSATDNIDVIFWEAANLPAGPERDAYLSHACGEDHELRQRVERLVCARPKLDRFLEAPFAGSAPAPPAPTDGPGTVVGSYKLLEKIGAGGMGAVFMAEQTRPVRRKVALKIIKPGMDSQQVVSRFEAERQALALMDHPNIAKVFDGGTTESGRPYFVMELVRGLPITDYCDQASLSIADRLQLFIAVCRAVQHAHTKGIIHRDLKPTNVLVTVVDGRPVPKIIDFGIAKAIGGGLTDRTLFTGFHQFVGTPMYMSPEQAELSGVDVDTRADIYALGVLLYELLTGTTPFDDEILRQAGFDEMRRMIREDAPPRPSARISTLDAAARSTTSSKRGLDQRQLSRLLHGDLDRIVMKALEKDRNRRYESAGAFAADIQRYLANEPIEARPPSAAYRLRKFVGRNRVALGSAGMAVALMLTVGWWIADWGGRKAETHRVVQQALEESLNLQQQNKYSEALSAARRADGLIAGGTVNRDLMEQVHRRCQDLELALRLGEIQLESTAVKDGHYDADLEDRRYGEEFRVAGIDVETMTVEDAAERILGTTVAAELGVVLDDWAILRNDMRRTKHLLEISRRVDPDEWRCRVRDALAARNSKAFPLLAMENDASQQPARSLNLLGHILVDKLGDSKTAIPFLTAAQQAHPGDFWINHRLAMAHVIAKPIQHEGAVRYFSVAAALRPETAGARFNLAKALEQAGRPGQALGVLREAIRLKPDYSHAHDRLGLVLRKLGRHDEAIAAFHEAVRLRPDFSAYHTNLGEVLCDVKKDYDGAIASFREAIRLDPGNADAHVNLGVALGLSGQYDEAVASYREAVRLRPNNHGDRERLLIAQSTVAAIWFNQNRHAKSESLLREAYALHQQWAAESRGRSEYPVVLGGICCNMGNVLADTNRSADALGWYDQAIQGLSAVLEKEQGPVEARSFLLNSYFGRSLALISLKRFAEALRDCDLALKTDDGSQQPSLRLHRARCQSHVDPDAAAKTIEDVLQAEKTSPANLYSGALAYGVAHAKAEDQPRRERYAVRAIELLHKAQAAGYFNDPNAVTNLQTEPDLDSLRNREDFRKFLKSLEGKTKR